MDPALSTISGILKHLADTHPHRVAILLPSRQELTFAGLNNLVEPAASRFLSSGIQRGDVVAVAFGNTVESFIMILAVIRCRAVAVPLHPAYTQEEFEFYLSLYEAKLLLTGPGGTRPAARAATARRVPHAVASLDFSSDHVQISSFAVAPAPGLAAAATGGTDEVVNKPWDAALLVHTPGAMSSGYAFTLTQKQLASCAKRGTDLGNLLRELASCLAGVDPLLQNHGLLETLTSAIPAGSLEASVDTGGGGVGRVFELPHSTAMVGLVAGTRADESDLKLKDVLSFSAGAVIAVSATLLSKQDPENAAEKATAPLLFLYGAVTFSLMGQVLKVVVGRFHGFFKAVAVLSFYCGAAALAVTLLRPGYSHTAFAVSLAAAGTSIFFLLSRMPWASPATPPPPPPPEADRAPEVPVPKHGHWLTKWLPGKQSQPPAGINVREEA